MAVENPGFLSGGVQVLPNLVLPYNRIAILVFAALVLLGMAALSAVIKRDLGIKDISTWLPGHGGFLDRVDSALLSAAAAYALFLIFA